MHAFNRASPGCVPSHANSAFFQFKGINSQRKGQEMAEGKIIILNGTSSSGKTSIVKALQTALDEPYLDAGLDRFLWMLPKRYLERPLWDDVLGLASQAGEIGHQLVSGMHHAIQALSKSGNNVIADHVLVEPSWLEACIHLFGELQAYLVGVRCPLHVLEQRESSRRDRTLGQARLQFDLVHKHGLYDVEVDTSISSPEECALQIVKRMETPPMALRELRMEKGV
jgi:chloramphenicol 3-O phosphotransferase